MSKTLLSSIVNAVINRDINIINEYLIIEHKETFDFLLHSMFANAIIGNKDEIRFLIEEVGININCRSDTGLTILHHAAEQGHEDLVKYLINQGANVHSLATDLFQTPLHIAASKGHTEIALMLIAAGADTKAKNSLGHTPANAAAINLHDNTNMCIEIADSLKDNNYDITSTLQCFNLEEIDSNLQSELYNLINRTKEFMLSSLPSNSITQASVMTATRTQHSQSYN